MNTGLLRILDANANRVREALRVLEDCARFSLNDLPLTEQLKRLRHDFASVVQMLPMSQALATRDTPNDVGTTITTEAEFQRASVADLLSANGKRLSEALRSMEECAKTLNPAAAARLEQFRYRGYTLEQLLLGRAGGVEAIGRFRRVRLCVLLTESLCPPGRTWEWVLDQILDGTDKAEVPAAGGARSLCVQLREKGLDDAELLRRASHVVQKCHDRGMLAIINDRPDVAMLSGADGVHLGQTDLPCERVRKLGGNELIIGVSTERLEQARRAVDAGATYIAVGPMYATTTKMKPRIAGPGYAAEVVGAIDRPIVAIGGITLQNIGAVVQAGVRAVAVSSAVVSSPQPAEQVRSFLEVLLRSPMGGNSHQMDGPGAPERR